MKTTIQTKYGTAKLNPNGYYWITSGKEGNNRKLLHRLIFEDFYNIKLDEEFPKGVYIHHIDENKTNNEIWNLEPISPGDHTKYHNTGRTLSEETKRKISLNHADTSGKNNGFYGKKHSIETKRKLSELRKGIPLSDEHKLNVSISRNTSGYFRVSKKKDKCVTQGFIWQYTYYENGKRKHLSSISLNRLRKRVLSKGLEWIKLTEVSHESDN